MSTNKISIIVPVYNDSMYVSECIESISKQKYTDFEAIFINDGSTDNTLDVLKKYAEQDSRIVIIDKKINEGTMLARKAGVEQAKGDYIIFVDADDYICDDLCEFINDVTQNNKEDIIQFSVDVKDYANNETSVRWHKNAFKPLQKSITSSNEILKHSFETYKISTTPVGKIYKTDICKKAYNFVPYEKNYIGEDIFTFFLIANFANSYKGIETKEYYVYCYGRGVTSDDNISLKKFKSYCEMSKWPKYLYDFLDANSFSSEKNIYVKLMAERMFNDCCKLFKKRIEDQYKATAAEVLLNSWNNSNISNNIWKKYLGMTKDDFIAYVNVPVYIKEAPAYTDSTPSISVIIPVYNVEKYIEECLDSVVNQTFTDIEIICVNDGSTDKSLDIINNYFEKDNRITVVSQKNGGLSVARNTGIELAKGKYIIFIDSDDTINSNSLEILYTTAENNSLDIIYFDSKSFFDTYEEAQKYKAKEISNRKSNTNTVMSGNDMLMLQFKSAEYSASACLQFIKLSLIKNSNLLFYKGLIHEDELFTPLAASKAERAMIIQDKLYNRRVREGSIIHAGLNYKNFEGIFISYAELMAAYIMGGRKCDPLLLRAKQLYKVSAQRYKKLSKEEKDKVARLLPEPYKSLFEISNFSPKNTIYKRVKKCIKVNGVKYTLKLFLKPFFKFIK